MVMVEYAHEKAEAALGALTVQSTDAEIAEVLVTFLLVGKVPPYVFTLNHNAKAAPCPVKVDKTHGDKTCSVAIRNPLEARNWLSGALLRGYEVSVGTHRERDTWSVAHERRSIAHAVTMTEYRAKRAAFKSSGVGPDPDDEIPF